MLLWWTVQELTVTPTLRWRDRGDRCEQPKRQVQAEHADIATLRMTRYVYNFFISSTYLGAGERQRDVLHGVRDAADADVCQRANTSTIHIGGMKSDRIFRYPKFSEKMNRFKDYFKYTVCNVQPYNVQLHEMLSYTVYVSLM